MGIVCAEPFRAILKPKTGNSTKSLVRESILFKLIFV
jgi:hypothetical protein